MILRSTSLANAVEERQLVDWMMATLGDTDATTLCDWVWEREKTGARYVAVLRHLQKEAARIGPSFLGTLIDHARKPREQVEAAEQLMAAMIPWVHRSQTAVIGHRGDPQVIEEELANLRHRLREEIRRMWPRKHRATIDGAIVAGTQIKNGRATLDYGAIAEALTRYDDPLAATAASSHG